MSKSILSEISENVTLYHRSHYPMKVGDTIKAKRDEDGKHWLEHIPSEVGLEYYRRKNFPDKPSRFTCVYSSVIPRSRFVDKGTLYVVKPRGKIHVTNSTIIDKFHDQFDRRNQNYEEMRRMVKESPEELEWYIDHFLADTYWGGGGRGTKKEDIEILSDSVIIVEIIDDSAKRLQVNQGYEVTENNVLLFWLHVYPKQYGHPTEQEMEIFENVRNYLFSHVEPEKGISPTEAKGYLRKGLKVMPIRLKTAMTKNSYDMQDEDERNLGKYNEILLSFELDGKWYNSYKDNLGGMTFDLKSHSFMKHYHKQPWDYGKYLKKI